jgi:cyclopropane fatty-acyl-phospholipid synthase-like methyltransferase
MLSHADVKPHTVCEVGCGAGEILRQLMDPGVRFVGYEISPQVHDLSRPRATDRLTFRLGDSLSDGGRPNAPFDLVLAMDVVERVEDYFGFLRRLRGLGNHKVFHITWTSLPTPPWAGP